MFLAIKTISILLCCLLLSGEVYGQSSESIRIPSNGDSCNVVNLNFGRAEDNSGQAQGPQGPPGKRGSPGVIGLKGSKGNRGEMGPTGVSPEIDIPRITTAVFKALGASSCDELMKVHGISETGYYLMRSNTTAYPVYTYCDFDVREEVNSCAQLIEILGNGFQPGYYLLDDQDVFHHCIDLPEDCKSADLHKAKVSNTSGGVFDILPDGKHQNVEVYCDLQTDGGGWTVFQRRMDGSVDFFRGWDDYVNGFGNTAGEFWLGLETIYQLTKDGSYELRVDLEDFSQNTVYAKYGTFSIASRDDNYRLTVGDYSGTAGDSLNYENSMQFSTKDADHDTWSSNCALTHDKGAWWYRDCTYSNLNGLYNKSPGSGTTGVVWRGWKGTNFLKFTEMKFRKKE